MVISITTLILLIGNQMHILAPYMSCVVSPDEFTEALAQNYKEIYIMTAKGILKHHQLRGENRFVRVKVASIPGYTEVEIKEGMNFLPAGKIPYTLFEQVHAFFLQVMKVKKADLEAMIHVLWNSEQGYHLGVPPQTISKASVTYDWSYIPSGTSIIVDIHSHNTMNSFFSGTDDSDDRKNISFSGVFGQLNKKEPATVWRFNYFEQKFTANLEDIFDMPEHPEVTIPTEWLDQIKTHSYPSYPNYQPYGGHSNLGNVHRVGQEGGNGRSYDHLKQFQFKKTPESGSPKGTNANNVTDFPTRSHTSEARRPMFPNDDLSEMEAGIESTFFGHDESIYVDDGMSSHPGNIRSRPTRPVQGRAHFNNQDYIYSSTYNMYILKADLNDDGSLKNPEDYFPPSGEAALANLIEDSEPVNLGEESHLGKLQGEPLNSMSRQQGNLLSLATNFIDERYELIAQEHGVAVADAWFDIDNCMHDLDGQSEIVIDLMSDMFNFVKEEDQAKLIRALFEQLPQRQKEKIEANGL